MKRCFFPIGAACCLLGCQTNPIEQVEQVGPASTGGHIVSTYQALHPAGESLEFTGRPVDLVLSPDGETLYVKDNRGLVVIDVPAWKIRQELKFPAGAGSTHGIVVTRDGTRVLVTTAQNTMWEARRDQANKLEWGRKFALPGPGGTGNSQPGGIALTTDEKRAYVCLSRNNSLGIVDLESGVLSKELPVGVAPFDVAIQAEGKTAFVSNWGGRHPKAGEKTSKSSGTDTLVDERTVAASGTVSVVDLDQGREIAQITTGLHPSDLELSVDQRTLYVANANSDTVSIIDTKSRRVVESVLVRPDPTLPFGSAPNALTLDQDGKTLLVANGGNNAVAVVALAAKSKLEGFIPTAWYPGALTTDGHFLFVANVKGLGSRQPGEGGQGWNSRRYLGTVSKIKIPTAPELQEYTRQAKTDARVPQILRAWERSDSRKKPVPVPRRLGEPSVFEHVVYIIKENRTYDQVFGDLPQGNADPALCVFGREVTPNHHAVAEQFALLDNYYCNGVLSADGHAWATEGYVTDYLEKSFGGFTRSYPFAGDDPLSYSATGFIWDNLLLHGLSFRNYGEMSTTAVLPKEADWLAIYENHRTNGNAMAFQHDMQIETLRRYSCAQSPGWNMRIPDRIRADVFLNEFSEYEKKGEWPNLVIIYLPNDHTSGTRVGSPTPRAQVADNDLAVGRIIERISRSRFWPRTCIFVNEDDPQAGFDHVDGHRSLCLVVSPYTKRGAVVSKFYNQTSVLHTMERMLGLPPMNQMDSLAPLMTDCFTGTPNFSPYNCLQNNIALDEMNKPTAQLQGLELYWAEQSLAQPLDQVDQADEDTFNRILWHSVKGVDRPYPAGLAGAHGKGLKRLKLSLTGETDDD
ncbi:MAG: bifunctional YncE family protein/alkaline phosphatase family protein [Verrucomicrobiota bacterium]